MSYKKNLELQRNSFFVVEVLYKDKQFLDIELFASLTRKITVSAKEVRLEVLQASNSYFYEMLKVFEKVDKNNFFELKLGYLDVKGNINGGFGFSLTKFDFALEECASNRMEDIGISEIVLKFSYNKKRVLTDKEIDYDPKKKLPDLTSVLVKMKLEEI